MPLRVAVPLAMIVQALAYWLVFSLFAYAAFRRGAGVSAVLVLRFWIAATTILVALATALRLADSPAILCVYAGVLATVAPHCLFGTAALSRYWFLPMLLAICGVAIVMIGTAIRRAPRLESAYIASM